jgi:hypothetical protein
VTFPSGLGAPPQVTLHNLASWTEHSAPGVKYFSGTATYTKDFDVPAALCDPGITLELDLGAVENLAEVTLNEKSLGVLWKPPFRVDITGLAKPKGNRLTVRVTNLWPNRMIGDEQEALDDAEWEIVPNRQDVTIGRTPVAVPEWVTARAPRPSSKRITFTSFNPYTKDSPLLPSGLLGPVTLVPSKRIPATKTSNAAASTKPL